MTEKTSEIKTEQYVFLFAVNIKATQNRCFVNSRSPTVSTTISDTDPRSVLHNDEM